LGADLLTIPSVYDIGRDHPKNNTTKLKKAKSFYGASMFGDEASLDIRDTNLDIDTHYYHDENDSDNDTNIDSESEYTETSEEGNVVTEGYDTQKYVFSELNFTQNSIIIIIYFFRLHIDFLNKGSEFWICFLLNTLV
jgi:hypothetical protein